ncbi:hypothetical protein [Paenarthrobacter sp. DKR-5]|nr:hypothetical protein [Paenarthrobacter sp. DKR-5]
MGSSANKPSTNVLTGAVIVFITVCAGAYAVTAFLQATHIIAAP